MDELEIEGKRYISSRRAAKENKYHIDYIGQLIRASKITGKKVGRAWYVEESSLHTYLEQENEGAQIVAAPRASSEVAAAAEQTPEVQLEPIISEVPTIPTADVLVEMEQEIIKEEMNEAVEEVKYAEPAAQKIHINIPPPPPPVQKLRNIIYVEDNEPMLPVLNHRANADFISVPLRRSAQQEPQAESPQEEELGEEQAPIQNKKVKTISIARKIPALAVAAVIVLAIVAIGSSFVATSITIDEGKPASVGFSLK